MPKKKQTKKSGTEKQSSLCEEDLTLLLSQTEVSLLNSKDGKATDK